MSDAARKLLGEMTRQEADAIPPDAAIGTFDPWDSLAHVRLFVALEEKLGRSLTSHEAVSIRSLKDVQLLLDAAE